jgi:hypothetical protein
MIADSRLSWSSLFRITIRIVARKRRVLGQGLWCVDLAMFPS